MKKQGWGGFSEFIGAYGLRRGSAKVPQWSWDFDSQAGRCVLSVRVTGIKDLKSQLSIEVAERGMMVCLHHYSAYDHTACRCTYILETRRSPPRKEAHLSTKWAGACQWNAA